MKLEACYSSNNVQWSLQVMEEQIIACFQKLTVLGKYVVTFSLWHQLIFKFHFIRSGLRWNSSLGKQEFFSYFLCIGQLFCYSECQTIYPFHANWVPGLNLKNHVPQSLHITILGHSIPVSQTISDRVMLIHLNWSIIDRDLGDKEKFKLIPV